MRILGSLWIITVLFASPVGAQSGAPWEGLQATGSPYFVVTSEIDGEIDVLPLKSTEAVVTIAGVIAEVKIIQRYVNQGSIPLEATYVFPGSTRAAVHGLQMRIGDRVRKAKIERRAQAKAAYETAKQEGKTATLLEQHRPNVFQMSIANIMPTEEVEVELRYTELLVPTKGVYQFVQPTVVGPRYAREEEQASGQQEEWVSNPYTDENHAPRYRYGVEVTIQAGMPIEKITSTSHKVGIEYLDPSQATIRLDDSEVHGGNRDFILSYVLEGESIQSGLLLYEGFDEKFFLLMTQPPEHIAEEIIPEREYIFVIDVSGSMHGFPLDVSKTLIRNLIGGLHEEESFNILLFSGASAVLSESSLSATPANLERAINLIESQRAGGGTELLPALRRALALPSEAGRSRTIVVISDGYISAEAAAFDLIRDNLGNANLFSFGIGTSVNRFLIEGLARIGQGEPTIITSAREANAAAENFRRYISAPVLTNIQIEYDGFEAYEVEPLSQPDLFAERPLLVFGKWKGIQEGTIRVSGTNGAGSYLAEFPVATYQLTTQLEALRYLWARHKIASLSDYHSSMRSSSMEEEITLLGLQYSLLTKYTSFIAIDELVRNPKAEGVSVTQPLPLPQGVSNHATGGSIPSVPEPEHYALLLAMMLALSWFHRAQIVDFLRCVNKE